MLYWLLTQVRWIIRTLLGVFGIRLHSVYEDEDNKYSIIQVDILQLIIVSIFFIFCVVVFAQLFKFILK